MGSTSNGGLPPKNSFIIYLPKPLKVFLKRFLPLLILFFAIFLFFTSRWEYAPTTALSHSIADRSSFLLKTIMAPVDMFSGTIQAIKNYFFVYQRNDILTKENTKLKQQILPLLATAQENKKLLSLLHYHNNLEYTYVTARVISSANNPFIRSLLIDTGTEYGITKGQAVINETGLVGRVIEVGKHSARVLLITDINSRIPVITSSTRERSILSGNNSTFPELLYLPEESNAQPGELVVTSGDGGFFPANIHIGVVRMTSDGKHMVQPFAKWHNLEYLSILTY